MSVFAFGFIATVAMTSEYGAPVKLDAPIMSFVGH
jgi:hypothetical protein